MVFISEGIATGVISEGKLLPGSHNLAGQFGHTIIEADGRAWGMHLHWQFWLTVGIKLSDKSLL